MIRTTKGLDYEWSLWFIFLVSSRCTDWLNWRTDNSHYFMVHTSDDMLYRKCIIKRCLFLLVSSLIWVLVEQRLTAHLLFYYYFCSFMKKSQPDIYLLTLSWPAGHICPTYKGSFQVRWDNSIPLFLHAAIYLEVSLFRWSSQNVFSRETAVYKWYCVQCC